MRNTREGGGVVDGLEGWVERMSWLAGHILFGTSGSSGRPKWVCLSKRAILRSAEAVNEHLEVTEADCWVRAIPDFHVGGLGIHARAWLGRNRVVVMEGIWDPAGFGLCCRLARATLSSLVPAQVYDLVEEGVRAPESLRAVLVGGGALGATLYEEACDLGWPLVRTYGLTEAASQVATEGWNAALGVGEDDGWLPVLSHWETRVGEDEVLSIRGESLMTAYVEREAVAGWVRRDGMCDGWFRTGDRVELRGGKEGLTELRFLDREGDMVKVLGELVSLANLRRRVYEYGRGLEVVGVQDERLGTRLILVREQNLAVEVAEACFREVNGTVAGYERLQDIVEID
ncbi:MAG: AMP-binding protein, partial [Verrucomicrobiota bacterium]